MKSRHVFVRSLTSRQWSRSGHRKSLTIWRSGQTERGSTSFLRGLQLWQKTSRNAIALRGPPVQRKASPPNHKATATKHKNFGSFDNRRRTSRDYSRRSASHTHNLRNATFSLGGPLTSGEVGKPTGGTAPSGPQMPQRATGGMMQSPRGISGRTHSTGRLHTRLRLESGISGSLPVFSSKQVKHSAPFTGPLAHQAAVSSGAGTAGLDACKSPLSAIISARTTAVSSQISLDGADYWPCV